VEGTDHARIGDARDALTIFIGNRCYMRMHEGHCAALVVDVRTRRFVCSIYANRPRVCRDLERASPACQAEIHEKSDRPLTALRRGREASR
jgi:Fe-S-cluster containining protein